MVRLPCGLTMLANGTSLNFQGKGHSAFWQRLILWTRVLMRRR